MTLSTRARQPQPATAIGDNYGAEFTVSKFRKAGISYLPSERVRSVIYLELLPLVNSTRVALLDDAGLLRELRGLERRRGTAGRDLVEKAPGSFDDRLKKASG